MNKKNIEKALLGISFEALISISSSYSHKKKRYGYLYTSYRKTDNSLRLGFADCLENKSREINMQGYKIKKARKGSNNEEKYIRKTLEELGITPNKFDGNYILTNKLLDNLIALGWPIDKTHFTL